MNAFDRIENQIDIWLGIFSRSGDVEAAQDAKCALAWARVAATAR